MDKEQLQQALSAIHDEATKMLAMELPEEAHDRVLRIISLTRYGFDIRTDKEIAGG